MWVLLIQYIEDLSRTEGLTLSPIGGISSCMTAFEWGHCIFPVFRLELKHQLVLGLRPTGHQTGHVPLALLASGLQAQTGYVIPSSGSLAC